MVNLQITQQSQRDLLLLESIVVPLSFLVLIWVFGGALAAALPIGVGVIAILGWGATATAVPPMLQAAAMRHAPEDPDGASGLYVAAFQVGIMAGSLIGGLLFEHAGEPVMLATSAMLIGGVLIAVMVSRDLFATAK